MEKSATVSPLSQTNHQNYSCGPHEMELSDGLKKPSGKPGIGPMNRFDKPEIIRKVMINNNIDIIFTYLQHGVKLSIAKCLRCTWEHWKGRSR